MFATDVREAADTYLESVNSTDVGDEFSPFDIEDLVQNEEALLSPYSRPQGKTESGNAFEVPSPIGLSSQHESGGQCVDEQSYVI